MSAYRDQLDPGISMRFTQHIGIAEHWLEEIEKIPAYIDKLERGDGITQGLMQVWMQKWAKGWENCWDQLREAREIVASQGRETSAFDAAFASAGDIYLDTAKGTATRPYRGTVHITWQNTPTAPAYTAIAALRGAMPEIVAPKQVDAPVDLQSSSNKTLRVIVTVVAILAAIFVVYKIVAR
ncbi:MAG TPA: hypothetical protein VMU47_14465 [Caldimonas sp.]|nr:hypothetical protein [Caldimonas sp.]